MKLERSYNFDLTSVCIRNAERKFQFQLSNKKKMQIVGWRGIIKYLCQCYSGKE